MLNIQKVENVYLACGYTNLRKSVNGLSIIVESKFKMEVNSETIFVFCNRQMNKLKILHFDNGYWLYYYRVESGKLKWPLTKEDIVGTTLKEFAWLLKGYEVRNGTKLKEITGMKNIY